MHYKLASLLGMNRAPEDSQALENMRAEIKKVGGLLHFTVTKHMDGWTAECEEISSIITGGTDPQPTDDEIQSNIREAIHTAFHITTDAVSEPRIYNTREVQALYSVTSNGALA